MQYIACLLFGHMPVSVMYGRFPTATRTQCARCGRTRAQDMRANEVWDR
jgi:hypothetical protein